MIHGTGLGVPLTINAIREYININSMGLAPGTLLAKTTINLQWPTISQREIPQEICKDVCLCPGMDGGVVKDEHLTTLKEIP